MLIEGKVNNFAYFLEDNSFITIGSDRTIKIVNKENGQYLKSFGEYESIDTIAIINNKKHIFVSEDCPPVIKMYEIESGKCIKTFAEEGEYSNNVEALEYDEKNNLLFSARNINLKVWELSTDKYIKDINNAEEDNIELYRSMRNGQINSISINSDSTFFATAGEDGRLLIWNLKTFQIVDKLYIYNFGSEFKTNYDPLLWDYKLTMLCQFNHLKKNEVIFSNPFQNYLESYNISEKKLNRFGKEELPSTICYLGTNLRKTILVSIHVIHYRKTILRKWDLFSEKLLLEIDLGAKALIKSVSFNSDDSEILIADYQGVYLYDAFSGKLLKEYS